MNKTALMLISVIALCGLVVISCRKTANDRLKTTPVIFNVPPGFPQPVFDVAANPITEEGFELGRKLFHDNILSKYRDVTCGSCHQQLAAYTTFDHDLGHGTNNQHTTRNVPGIFNMVWQSSFEWDGRISRLDEQPIACITAPERMGETIENVVKKLDTAAVYKQMFVEAFGSEIINEQRIANALVQFVAMLVSADSKYDRVKQGTEQFNANEAAGYELFKSNCSGCHAEPLFTDYSFRNIGLPHRDFHEDAGRMLVTGDSQDSLKFKVPSLRNVGITSYYAHDGRFAGISEILEHYSGGVMPGENVDPLVRDGIPLTNLERFYIQEFLLTLTDSSLVKDPRFR